MPYGSRNDNTAESFRLLLYIKYYYVMNEKRGNNVIHSVI